MNKLERLTDEVTANGIDIVDGHFSRTKKTACLHKDGYYKAIVLDKFQIETPAEELSLLAEEYAHYETGGLYMVEATYNMPIGRINRIAYEGRAKRHAIKKHLPFKRLKDTIQMRKPCDDWELAEELGFSVEFVREAVKYYTESQELNLEE